MERIRYLFDTFLNFFAPRNRWGGNPTFPQPQTGGGRTTRPPINPAAHTFRNIFVPRHVDEQQIIFRPVPHDGVMPKRKEDWFRDGQTQRSRVQQSMVITASGTIIRPDQVKLKCFCGRYEHIIHYCETCNRGLCMLCVRKFRTASGREVILCERDLQIAINAFNTWQSRQHPS